MPFSFESLLGIGLMGLVEELRFLNLPNPGLKFDPNLGLFGVIKIKL